VDAKQLRRFAQNFFFFRIFNGLVDFAADCDHGGFRRLVPRLAPSCFHSASWDARGQRQEANR
jgi:hypothetical protein